MPSTIDHLVSLARYAVHRDGRERADAAAMRELAGTALPLPRGLELEWLGVAGYRLTYQGHTLYLDPYLTRVPLAAVLRRTPAVADPDLHERHLGDGHGHVVGLLVGHTHFDHAVDVPEIARRFGTRAYGSGSLVNLMRLYGLGDQAVEVVPHHPYELGPFVVTFVPSVHSKLLLGYRVPFDGELTCEHLDALSPGAFRCGRVYGIHIAVAGATLYHVGSGDLIDDEVPRGGVDILLTAIAGRSFTPGFLPRILRSVEPRAVVASHFDDFFRPVSAPIGFSLNVNLAAFPEEVAAVGRDFSVAALEPMVAVRGE